MKFCPSLARQRVKSYLLALGLVSCVVISWNCSWCADASGTPAATVKSESDPSQAPLEANSLWAGLVFASNNAPAAEEVGKETRKDQLFPELVVRLKKAFPAYKTFDLVGVDHVPIFRAYESWAVLSADKYFNLKFDSKGMDENGGLKLHMQLWQDKKVLVKADAALRKEQPLFIAGPKWRDGQLMFVVMINNNHS